MGNGFEEQLHTVGLDVLTPLVRLALHDKGASVIDWQLEPMRGNAGLGAYGIARLQGLAGVENNIVGWSIICKAIRGDGGGVSREPAAWNYWKREVLAYQTDLLADLPVGIRAPRCYGITQRDDMEYWMWLEDLDMQSEHQWSLAHYGLAARHLGQFNGAYLAGKRIPDMHWLSASRVEMWVQFATENIETLSGASEDTEMHPWLETRRWERTLALWREREHILNGLTSLPRCLCHHDALPRNLFLHRSDGGHESIIAIDWAMVGPGRVGQEIASMLGGALSFMDVTMHDVEEIERTVFVSYLAGLREAGWHGNANLVRYGYCATLALVWGLGLCVYALTNLTNEEWRAGVERVTGHTYEQYLQQAFALVDFALDHGEEAIGLMESLTT